MGTMYTEKTPGRVNLSILLNNFLLCGWKDPATQILQLRECSPG